MITIEMVQLIVTILTAVIVPLIGFYVHSTVKATVNEAVNKASKDADERLSAFELTMTASFGDSKTHQKESEMRHDASERRTAFLERQWEALQARTDQQQQFQHEIVRTQEGIAKIMSRMMEHMDNSAEQRPLRTSKRAGD